MRQGIKDRKKPSYKAPMGKIGLAHIKDNSWPTVKLTIIMNAAVSRGPAGGIEKK